MTIECGTIHLSTVGSSLGTCPLSQNISVTNSSAGGIRVPLALSILLLAVGNSLVQAHCGWSSDCEVMISLTVSHCNLLDLMPVAPLSFLCSYSRSMTIWAMECLLQVVFKDTLWAMARGSMVKMREEGKARAGGVPRIDIEHEEPAKLGGTGGGEL